MRDRRLHVVAAAAAAGLYAILLFATGSRSAHAAGLDFTCNAGEEVASTATDVDVLTGLDVTFDGEGPGGETVSRTFTADLTPLAFDRFTEFRVGGVHLPTGGAQTDFANMSFVDLDGDGAQDLGFVFGPRLSTGPGVTGSYTGQNPINPLMQDNFGVSPDYLLTDYVAGVGVDLRVLRFGDAAANFRGTFGINLVYENTPIDGSPAFDTYQRIRIGLDALDGAGEGAEWPDESRVSSFFKQFGDGVRSVLGVGQEFRYEEVAPADRPPLGVDVDVDEIEADGTPLGQLVDVDLDWEPAPSDFAIGGRERCLAVEGFDSTAQVGWNRTLETADTPDPTLDVGLRMGIGEGIGSTPSDPVDEMAIDADISDLPRRLDWLLTPEHMAVQRSADTAPGIGLERFQMAYDNASPDDEPLYVTGHVDGLPERTDAVAQFGADGMEKADVWFCPPSAVAPEDPVLPFTACAAEPFAPAVVEVVLQNFLPGAPHTEELDTLPADGSPYLLYNVQRPRTIYTPDATLDVREMWRYGGRVHGLEHVGYDTTTAPADGSGVSVHAATDGTTGSTTALVRIDERDELGIFNQGWLVDAEGVIEPLATELDVSYASTLARPIAASYESDTSSRVTGNAHVEGPGSSGYLPNPFGHLRIDAQFDIGAGNAGLPKKVDLNLDRKWDGPGSNTQHSLVYRADTQAHVIAGAVVTNFSDRVYGRRTRIHADVTVPRSLDANWIEDANGDLVHVDAKTCTPFVLPVPDWDDLPIVVARSTGGATAQDIAGPAAFRPRLGCQENTVNATAVRGAPEDSDADLLVPPQLPAVPVGNVVPAFTDPSAGEGLRVVIPELPGDTWGAQLGLRNLEDARYDTGPSDFCLRTAPTGNPFVANIFDAYADGKVLFVDTVLGRLPREIHARIETDSADSEKPWIWVDTDSCDLEEPPVDIQPSDTPGGIPMWATIRAGSAFALSYINTDPVQEGLAADRGVGADLLFRYMIGEWGIHARLHQDLPEQLMLWNPTSCDAASETERLHNCQTAPHYGPDDVTDLGLKFRSSATQLGDLVVKGWYLGEGGPFLDIAGSLQRIPGRLDGGFTMIQNARLPWTDLDVSLHGNIGIGDVDASIVDRNDPAYRGDPANHTDDNEVPKYLLDIDGVSADLELSAAIHLTETPNEKPTPPELVCEDRYGGRGPTRLAYLHEHLTLGPNVHNVDISVTDGRDEDDIFGDSDTPHYAAAIKADAPITAETDVKLENVAVGILKDPWWGWIEVCIDFDPAMSFDITNVRDGHLGMGGPRVVMDVSDADYAAGGRMNGRIGEAYVCRVNCPSGTAPGTLIDRGGAFFAYHFYDINVHPILFYLDSGPNRDTWRGIGIINSANNCLGNPCYGLADDNDISWDYVERGGTRVTGYKSADFLLDPVFSEGTRFGLMLTDILNIGLRPGSRIYGALKDAGDQPFDFRTPPSRLRSVALDGSTPGFIFPRSFVTTRKNGCTDSGEEALGAIGNDFTIYSIAYKSKCVPVPGGNQYRHTLYTALVARHRNGQIRWVKPLETSDNNERNGEVQRNRLWVYGWDYRFDVRLEPMPNGGVCARVRPWTTPDGWFTNWRQGCVDNSGYGLFYDTQIWLVPSPTPAQLGQPVSFTANTAPSRTATRVWHFGDGTQEPGSFGPQTRTHVYRQAGEYMVLVQDYDNKGRLLASKIFYIRVQAPPPPP